MTVCLGKDKKSFSLLDSVFFPSSLRPLLANPGPNKQRFGRKQLIRNSESFLFFNRRVPKRKCLLGAALVRNLHWSSHSRVSPESKWNLRNCKPHSESPGSLNKIPHFHSQNQILSKKSNLINFTNEIGFKICFQN